MGTSKGYISPTRIQWTQAKRAITQMLRDGDNDSRAKASGKFATAMKADSTPNSTFSRAVSGLMGLAKNVSTHGVDYALNQVNRPDLIGKSPDEIWNQLFHEYTNNGSSVEDALAADALSTAISNLNITDLEQLGSLSPEIFLKEMLIAFIVINFNFRFSEKIEKDRTPVEARRVLDEMQKYIESSLYEKISLNDIGNIDFSNLSGSQYIDKVLNDAYTVFEEQYTEE